MDGQFNESQPIGGLRPPPGVTPNFVDPYSTRAYFILTFVMCVTITSIFILVRAYTKLYIIKSHQWEDYTSYVAWLGLIGYFGFGFVAFKYGAGVHQWNVTADDVMLVAQVFNAQEAFYAPLIYITKLSILLQYLRIFVPARAGVRYYLIHALIWLNLIYYIINFFVGLFFCTPRRKLWNPSVPGHCLNSAASITSAAAINVLSDVTVLLLPIFCILALQMPLSRKLAVSAVFATGFFACVASIMRLVFSVKLINATDLTYDVVPLALWSDAEVASGIICGCMPITPKFLRHFLPIIKSRLRSRRYSDGTALPGPSTEDGHSPTAAAAVLGVGGPRKSRRMSGGVFVELGWREEKAENERGAWDEQK